MTTYKIGVFGPLPIGLLFSSAVVIAWLRGGGLPSTPGASFKHTRPLQLSRGKTWLPLSGDLGRGDEGSCFSGKRIFILGNSVARGMAFEAASMLQGAVQQAGRAVQQGACGVTLNMTSSDTCSLHAGGVDIFFTWLQLFDGLAPGIPHDACTAAALTTHECMAKVLSRSRPGDVLIFYLGLHYAIHQQDVASADPAFDFYSWARKSMDVWGASLNSLWPGRAQDIFRVRVANMRERDARQQLAIAEIPFINAAMDEAFEGMGWSVVDQWGINQGREDLYEDHVHFPGILTRESLRAIFTAACARGSR